MLEDKLIIVDKDGYLFMRENDPERLYELVEFMNLREGLCFRIYMKQALECIQKDGFIDYSKLSTSKPAAYVMGGKVNEKYLIFNVLDYCYKSGLIDKNVYEIIELDKIEVFEGIISDIHISEQGMCVLESIDTYWDEDPIAIRKRIIDTLYKAVEGQSTLVMRGSTTYS